MQAPHFTSPHWTHSIQHSEALLVHAHIPCILAELMPALQRALNFSAAQRAALFSARRRYLFSLAAIGRKRQALLQQLQSSPRQLAANNLETAQQFLSADDLLQQLQSCSLEENDAFMLFSRTMGHKVLPNGFTLMVRHSHIVMCWMSLLDNYT